MDYDPDTGLFRWRVKTGRSVHIGAVAGHFAKRGYVEIRIDGHLWHAHRLAWLWMTGSWPIAEIDHKNKDRNDTRWSNLREATHGQNGVHKGANKNNKFGIKGVRMRRGRFEAHIWKNGGDFWIGSFNTAEEASAAYIAVAYELHGEFCYAASI